ncbi:DUF7563 family protein [Natrinema zhouii]
MPKCQNCEGHITVDFIRVFGIDGEAHRCPACSTNSELKEGAGARGDAEP